VLINFPSDAPLIIKRATKTADQVVNNSAVLVDDTDLTISLPAVTAYYGFLAFLRVNGASVNSDFKASIKATGLFAYWDVLRNQDALPYAIGGLGVPVGRTPVTQLVQGDTVSLGSGAGADFTVILIGSAFNTGIVRSLTIQWCQVNAVAEDTKVRAGSWLTVVKLN